MSIRAGLIKAARRACPADGITIEKAAAVFLRKLNLDGGFRGKGTQSDLYYTGFALMSLTALRQSLELPHLCDFLDSFGDGDGLDLAHLAALVRGRFLTDRLTPAAVSVLAERLETFRCKDGAYHHLCSGNEGSAYGCFLALGAYQDLSLPLPDAVAILDCIDKLKTDSGYYNEAMLPLVSAPGTAAAVNTLTELGRPVDPRDVDWLFTSRDPHGGFKVMPAAPTADLLSTAVALHTLAAVGADLEPIRHIDCAYVLGLWNDRVGFCQNRIDPISDCEYCFYGLLSLGHLR